VKGLEVVLPTGELLKLGGKLLKNNQGLDLLHLMVHSEGILGVITKVIFRLYPQAVASATLLISYNDRHQAIDTVPEILRSGVIPLAIEYVERDVVEISARYLGATWPATKGKAFLIVILNGVTEDEIYSQAEKVTEICEKLGAVDTLVAERKEEQEEILHIRSELYSAMKSHMGDTLDVVVPPASVGILTNMVDAIAEKYNTVIPIYGHVADGNFHPHPMIDLEERGILHEVKREIYKAAIELGGVVTGEHGVGQIRNVDLDLYPAGKSWQLMRGIKKVFDPNGILNPGVGLP
jgi:glycolate oxidase